MNPIQKIALTWYKIIDGTGTLYDMLRDLNIYVRLVFYIGLVLFTFFVLQLTEKFLPLAKYGAEGLYIFLTYLTTASTALVVTYESIYNLNVKAIIQMQKEDRDYIKRAKLQKWRLRNMLFLLRIGVYIFCYIIIASLIQLIVVMAFMENYPMAGEQELKMLKESYYIMLGYFTMFYAFLFLVLEFFTRKIQERGTHA